MPGVRSRVGRQCKDIVDEISQTLVVAVVQSTYEQDK